MAQQKLVIATLAVLLAAGALFFMTPQTLDIT
jgi:hypothetical protein